MSSSSPFSEDDYLTLSSLRQYSYCPRQCALVHNDASWEENVHTVLGKLEHERVDEGSDTWVGHTLEARSVALVCHRLGIYGLSDVVEYQYEEDHCTLKRILPIEYKHGKPKEGQIDEVQLCAQALCLEELNDVAIPVAYLYYRKLGRRVKIELDEQLRLLTEQRVQEVRDLIRSRIIPHAKRSDRCRGCSEMSACLPSRCKVNVVQFNQRQFQQVLENIED